MAARKFTETEADALEDLRRENAALKEAVENLAWRTAPYRVTGYGLQLRGEEYVGILTLECASGEGLSVATGDVVRVSPL